jgi:long-subunit fatty acid transport protein
MKVKLLLTIFMLPALMVLAQEEKSPGPETIFFSGHELGVGARAMGMGGAYTGVADDYSAIYWNPAGLGQMRRSEFSVGFSHNQVQNTVTYRDQELETDDTFSRLNTIGFAFPLPTYKGSLVFGIGYNKIRDFDDVLEVDVFNDEDSLYQGESMFQEGSLNEFSLAGAMEIQRNFYIGATVSFLTGKEDYTVRYDEEDAMDLYTFDQYLYDQNIISDLSGTKFKLGAFYKWGIFRFGATVTPPTTIRVKETWSESEEEYFDNQEQAEGFEDSGELEYKYQKPYVFGVGGSVKLLNFLFSGDVEFVDWSQAEFKTEPPFGELSKTDLNIWMKQNLQAVTKVHLGAEMYIPLLRGRVRVGYQNEPTAYEYATLMPEREYLSAGASLQLTKQVMLDAVLVHGMWEQESIDDILGQKTIEDKTFDKIIATLSVRF